MLKESLPYIIAVVVLVLVFSLLGYPLVKNIDKQNSLLAENVGKLKKIYSSPDLPSNELIDAMKRNNAELEEKYESLKAKLPVLKELSVPEGVNRSLFYLEELKNIRGNILMKASGKRIQVLSENLGLPSSLPSESEAPQLLRNLYLTETVIDLLLDADVASIDNITLGAARNTNMYEDVPLMLQLRCNTSALSKLLFELENSDKVFLVVKNFSLTPTITPTMVGSDAAAMSNIAAGRGSPSGPTVNLGEKIIQIDLELSIIIWK
ncbi:MAG: Amuc_1100 family pilus-like protein [Candidatus Ratteibacteria bacterium]|nr:Amuc_1100 family pilus-like protein [Candidatus Ratteibacteria bacterium]